MGGPVAALFSTSMPMTDEGSSSSGAEPLTTWLIHCLLTAFIMTLCCMLIHDLVSVAVCVHVLLGRSDTVGCSCIVVMFAAPQWVCIWTWRLLLALGQLGSGRQTNRENGWPGNRTCLCSSRRNWNLRKWMKLRTRQEREVRLSLEQRQSVSQQGLCVNVCVWLCA